MQLFWIKTISIRLKRTAIIAVIVIGLPVGSIGAYSGVLILGGNLHVVEEGQVYRSAQLDKAQLEHVIAENGIRSILNLRGPNVGQSWYQDEIGVSNARGIAHYDVGLSAKRRVPADTMQKLVEIVRQAPKPLLIHCKSGADRTGLVAALYRYAIEGSSAEHAATELSLRYGHFPWLTSKSGAMDDSFRAYQIEIRAATAGGG